MPRPTSKAMLLTESQKEHDALDKQLSTLTPAQMIQSDIVGLWSVKDVLAHLYEWEQMVLGWLATSEQGEMPHVPAKGYKWNQLPALNEQIYQQYKDWSLDEARVMWEESYSQVTARIEEILEERLFTPGLYPWMNKNTLAAYFTSCTSSHYRWARKEIRKGFRVQA